MIYRLFRQKRIKIGLRAVMPEERLKKGDVVLISLPSNFAINDKSTASATVPSFDGASLHILPDSPCKLWENEHLIAFHKPRGMLTHDGGASLDAFARDYLRDSLPPSVSFSPGPLHRLDRNTSGIIMFSKSRLGADVFSEAIRNHRIRKFYIAIVQGEVEDEITLEDDLTRDKDQRKTAAVGEGKTAKLCLLPLASSKGLTLALIEPYTGLTHQIRAQLAVHGHPLVGDVKYNSSEKSQADGYFLHAHTLQFPSALFPGMPKRISDPLPQTFETHALKILQSGKTPSNGALPCSITLDDVLLSDTPRDVASPYASSIDDCILKTIDRLISS